MVIFYVFIAFLILALLYQDIAQRRDSRHKDQVIHDLQLKFMSRDVGEYQRAVEPKPEPMEDTIDPYVSLEDVPTDILMRAEDNL